MDSEQQAHSPTVRVGEPALARFESWCLIAVAVALCSGLAARPALAEDPPPPTCSAERLADLKSRVMQADYAADLGGLQSAAADLEPCVESSHHGGLAGYWLGFAHWRHAINGANRAIPRTAIHDSLLAAEAAFESAPDAESVQADVDAAHASIVAWLIRFEPSDGDPSAVIERSRRSRELLARAKELAPENPRVLWCEAGILLGTPTEWGGDPQRAQELFARAAELARAEPSDPLAPDWGEAESLAALASGLNQSDPPDKVKAKALALQALELQPSWYWAREILLPSI